jgi:hypothetical protein
MVACKPGIIDLLRRTRPEYVLRSVDFREDVMKSASLHLYTHCVEA